MAIFFSDGFCNVRSAAGTVQGMEGAFSGAVTRRRAPADCACRPPHAGPARDVQAGGARRAAAQSRSESVRAIRSAL